MVNLISKDLIRLRHSIMSIKNSEWQTHLSSACKQSSTASYRSTFKKFLPTTSLLSAFISSRKLSRVHDAFYWFYLRPSFLRICLLLFLALHFIKCRENHLLFTYCEERDKKFTCVHDTMTWTIRVSKFIFGTFVFGI